ncbi:Splicing factor [Conoideocrella luteorostrata]|uniref:Splicing factor n=1 Tax=Conoideocrella luteorostrata TaxID=1105319 RepID=A0AAJ0CVQ4_9HYPO|nr:Splicing factor [Conoideocrella luteorostrata]
MANPIGEDSWIAYLEETARHASDLEQRVNIIELYKRAVSAEPGSLRLWLAYCDFFRVLWENSNSSDAQWSEEEQMMGQELFSLDASLDLWQQGYEAVQYRMSDSHELWDRWISFEMEEFTKSKTPDSLRRIIQLYRERLSVPHLTWDETSQSFSSFLSEHDQSAWEETMKEITTSAQITKRAIQVRDPFELKLKQTERNGDAEAQKSQLREYLDWEQRGTKRKHGDTELSVKLCSGLFDRALTSLFATDEDVWYDYIVFLSSTFDAQSSSDRLLDASRRAVQHCPSSGQLWSRYIQCAEEADLPFEDIEVIKQRANGDSQLCKDGMENMIEMYGAWCAFLKRMALNPTATDEQTDFAESGLKAAIEDVTKTGKRLYGKDFQGDPKYRLERIYIQYLTEKKDAIDEARLLWKKLERNVIHADSHDFWINYYTWEMLVFSSGFSCSDDRGIPTMATATLQSAATRKNIDWPEKILEVYMQHCNVYETTDVVRRAKDYVHQTQKVLTYRRKRDQEAQAAQYAAYVEAQARDQAQTEASSQQQAASEDRLSPSGSKRKRDSNVDIQHDDSENAIKRRRNGDEAVDDMASDQLPKRDREHATVLVTNLPFEITQTEILKYFKPYGHINNITAFAKDEQKQSATALIEFSTTEEAQSALLRDAKYFGESQISVQPGHDLTVYIANFPPAADENFIKDLFKDCGEILSIRWPSLKVNTHRRFCYLSFLDRGASAKAVAKEGKLLEGKYRLLAKYSDPSRKKKREGAIAEGREIHIGNLDRSTTEADLRDVFSKFGTVMRVNIPQNVAGRSRGFAFLDLETKEQAAKAAKELHNTKFRSQILQVQISKESKVKPTAKTADFQRLSASPAPPSARDDGDEVMDDGDTSQDLNEPPRSSEIAARTIALMGLPDTVNDARVKALVEPLGSIIKLIHQPGYGGATIEFADVATAGKAALQLSTMEYEGHQLRTGSADELRQNKTHSINNNAGKPQKQDMPKPKGGFIPPPRSIRRPTLGKLGAKRGLGFAPRKSSPASGAGLAESAASNDAPKSNDDFKAMFLAGRKEEKPEGKDA